MTSTIKLNQKNSIKEKHKNYIKLLLKVFNCDLNTFNYYLKAGFISIAGGYARRLYMLQNDIELNDRDMLDFSNESDMDVFLMRSYTVETVHKKTILSLRKHSRILKTIVFHPTLDDIKLYNEYIQEKTNRIPLSNMSSMNLGKHIPLIKLLESNNDNSFVIENDHLINATSGNDNILDIEDNNLRLQIILTKANKEKTQNAKYLTNYLLDSFDLSVSKYAITELAYDIDDVKIISKNKQNNIFDARIENSHNKLSQIKRLCKYSSYGFYFTQSNINDLIYGRIANIDYFNFFHKYY